MPLPVGALRAEASEAIWASGVCRIIIQSHTWKRRRCYIITGFGAE